ncbi:hypothetical protein LMTR3_11395 [Bradyrhizobium sp. LMTR 3]|nr:hypothetical protein LMTR3_11395 [Bradyrhizobium sp. LMTR 3]
MKAAAASVLVVAGLPPDGGPRPEFMLLADKLEHAVVEFRRARIASRLARPRILEEIRSEGIGRFFAASEIRARSRARHAAQAAAETLCMPIAANDGEARFQEAALAVYENELGGSVGFRDRFPPSRRHRGCE